MISKGLILLAIVATCSAKAQLGILKDLGSKVTGVFDGCKDKESSFITNPTACALLFDHSNCRDLKREVPEGYTKLGFRDRNDVESILVKKGCTIIGYDEDAENVYKRGQYFGITAYGQPNAVGKTLSGKAELEADMEAVNCTCGVPVDIGKCTQPIPQGVACILYDDKDCSVDDWDEPLFFGCGEEKSFSVLKSVKNIFYKNEAEAITVRKGCTLEVFDDSDFSDDQKKFTATDKDLHINLADTWKTKTTNKDIESLKCYCANQESAPFCKKA